MFPNRDNNSCDGDRSSVAERANCRILSLLQWIENGVWDKNIDLIRRFLPAVWDGTAGVVPRILDRGS